MVINSILDNDLYKFTMQYAVLQNKQLSNLYVRYHFFNRNDVKFPEGFDRRLKEEIQNMASLKLNPYEKKFLKEKLSVFLPIFYFDFLDGYKYDPSEVSIYMDDNGKLKVKIEGYWYRTILWEVPLMAIISQLYFEMSGYNFYNSSLKEERFKNNQQKAIDLKMNTVKFADFGTRRRFSYDNQDEVIKDMVDYAGENFVGTSNVHFAQLYNIKPIGTHAHEWFMVHSALYGYKLANNIGLKNWVEAYNGNLGIALTDTFTTRVFLKEFDMMYSKLFDGVRHDSGDPFEYVDKIVEHYNSLNIDSSSKTIVFSDGLNAKSTVKIHDYCKKKGINASFGIGTNLTNDLEGIKPLNIVIKITGVQYQGEWHPVVKLSDNLGKHTGNLDEIELSKKILKVGDIIYDKQQAGNEDDKPKINSINE